MEKPLSYCPPSNLQILLIHRAKHICFKITGTVQGLKSFPHQQMTLHHRNQSSVRKKILFVVLAFKLQDKYLGTISSLSSQLLQWSAWYPIAYTLPCTEVKTILELSFSEQGDEISQGPKMTLYWEYTYTYFFFSVIVIDSVNVIKCHFLEILKKQVLFRPADEEIILKLDAGLMPKIHFRSILKSTQNYYILQGCSHSKKYFKYEQKGKKM